MNTALDEHWIRVPGGAVRTKANLDAREMLCYSERPVTLSGMLANDTNASEFLDGYRRSGDIASIDENGFVRIFGRRQDKISRGGFKVFSAEVEDKLNQQAAVLECDVGGDPGERAHAFVVARCGMAIDIGAPRSFCNAHMSDYKRPKSVTVLTTPLPRNNNGKIQKQTLRAMLQKQDSSATQSRGNKLVPGGDRGTSTCGAVKQRAQNDQARK